MPDAQMINDIERWSADRLGHWLDDSMMRYKLIGLEHDDAITHVLMALMAMLGNLFACNTTNTPEQAAFELLKVIRTIRGWPDADARADRGSRT